MSKHYKFKSAISFVLVLSMLLSFVFIPPLATAYNCKSGDTACEEARQNMLDNRSEANSYIAKANSVSDIIAQIDSEIAAINAAIAANEAEIKHLNQEIQKTEAKLHDDQSALAEMLINIHFESNSEPIRILASSKTISDLAEKQAREVVVKQEIAATSAKIKQEKESLDAQKAEVEAKLAENQNNRNNAAAKRSEQEDIRVQYEKNADEASIVAAYWENLVKQLAYTPPSNTVGLGNRYFGAFNSYSEQDNCPAMNLAYSAYGGAVCQCTSYASFKAAEKWGVNIGGYVYGRTYDYIGIYSAHAKYYRYGDGLYVPATGATTYVDREAAANTIAVIVDDIYGHVMWVEGVNDNGTINITEYNMDWPSIGCYPGDFCSRENVGTSGMYFVHFE